VFRGLFGKKSDRPAPPKGQIEVVCPSCGAAQFEPRMVVSTFCKKCGIHLSINRKQVSASTVSRAGGMIDDSAWQMPKQGNAVPTVAAPPPPAAKTPDRASEKSEHIQPVTDEEAEEGGFGVFLKQQLAPVAKPAAQPAESPLAALRQVPQREEPQVERRPQSNSPPPTPAPELMSASTLQKMKDQGMYRNAYFKDADCFDCGHKFKVSRSSRSANCPTCGAYISLEDVEINMPTTQSIKTRGDVLVRKRGHLSAESIRCKDLRCQGIIEANIETSGDAIFRTVGTIIGEVRCKRFVIEKGADVTFINSIYAEEADIQSRVTGTIFSSGPLVIGGNGAVNGDITARSVSIEPGGELNGAMNIVRSQAPPKPTV
jgi:cytoskeletal protein CcmA (bactofilin family)/ribosomal protein S27E